MPKRAVIATREYLRQVPLPTHATSYTVITHETVIVNALEQLKLRGFEVETERYRCSTSGEVAIGVYQLKYKSDPELGMMFAWANSYDKSMRFKCAVGGFVRVSDSSIISGDFSWGRKHTGTADQEMIATITDQITNGQTYYDGILSVKEQMKQNRMDRTEISTFLGKAFFQKGLFSKEQVGIVRDELLKPSFDYNAPLNSLWTYYNHMLIALKKANPRTWMDEQRDLHNYVCEYFGIILLTGTVTGAAGMVSDGNPTATNGSTGFSTPTGNIEDLTVTVTNTEPVIIQAESTTGPINIYQAAEQPESKFRTTITSPESDVTPEEQAKIDAAIDALDKMEIKAPSLNLPE